MSVSEVCSKLRKPGLQLSELCTLINTLGDCLTYEILDDNHNVAQIKSGWEQLIEILIQTNHPTVRHIAFQNVKYILNGKNRISEKKLILSEISSGVVKLLYHWNVNIQLEIMEVVLQDEYPIENHKITLNQPCILSFLINSDFEILNYLLSLLIQYNNCQFYFVVLKMLKSFKLAIKDIHSKEAVKCIVDKVCQLEKNLSFEEINCETLNNETVQNNLQELSSYSKQEFLVIIFEIFNNIPDKFQDVKFVCYNMIKDEMSLLLNENLLLKINYFPYYNLIEIGFKVMTRISSCHPLISHDHMKWMRSLWNLINSKIFGDDLSKYIVNNSIIFKILNQAIKSILTIYFEKGQVLFIWNFELKEINTCNIQVDNHLIKDEDIFILSLEQIVQVFIQFISNLSKEHFCLNNGICEYVLYLSTIINIGLELDNTQISQTHKSYFERFLIDLVHSVAHFLDGIKDLEVFQPFQGDNNKLVESYFVLNFIFCKSHYLLSLFDNDHQFEIKEKKLIEELCSNFIEWTIYHCNTYNREFLNISSELSFKLLYFDLAPSWMNKYNKYQRIGLLYVNNPEIILLTIIRNLYKFNCLNNKAVSLFNWNLNNEEIAKLFSNFYLCCLYFHKLDTKVKEETLDYSELENNIEQVVLSHIQSLNVNNIYKYAKYFAVIGRFKISKVMFESIKLYTLESCAWINILVDITQFYGKIQSFFKDLKDSDNQHNSCLTAHKKLVNQLRSSLNNVESNFVYINNSKNCFFSSIYLSGISKINQFLSKSFNSRFNIESDNNQIDHSEILFHLIDILKTIFGLANIAKLISLQNFQIIIKIYWSLKQISLNIILSQLKFIMDSFPDTINMGINEKSRISKSLNLLKETLIYTLGQKIPKFNALIEKSFIDNAIPLFKLLKFNSISQLELQLIPRKVSSENLANIFLLNLKKHPNDLLISIFKNPRKSEEKSSFSLIYLRNLFPNQKCSSSPSSSEIQYNFPENALSGEMSARLWQTVNSDALMHACMHVLACVGRFPPVLLVQKVLPHIYLRGELVGFQNNKDCADSLEVSSSRLNSDNDNQAAPVLKLYGVFKSGFQNYSSENCLWVRLKLSYLLKDGEELFASHILDLSVTESHFSWVQPIERIPNAQKLKIVSVPLNQYKICIGIPYILSINII